MDHETFSSPLHALHKDTFPFTLWNRSTIEDIRRLVSCWCDAVVDERHRIAALISNDHLERLLLFSQEVASWAVAEHSEPLIEDGMAALALLDLRADFREILMALCLHYNAALRIRADPHRTLLQAAHCGSNRFREFVAEYLRSGEKNLGLMGYVEWTKDGHFAYLRQMNW